MKKYIGLIVMAVGLLWLFLDYRFGLSHFNILLIIPFCLVVGGLLLYVFFKKRESIY